MNPMASWPRGTLRMLTHVYGGVSPVFLKAIELSSCKCNNVIFILATYSYAQIDTRVLFNLVLVMNNFAILVHSICRIIMISNVTFTIICF